MNAPKTKLEVYRGELLPPDRKEELFKSLPKHIRPEIFERNLVNALMQNPALMAHPPALVFREVSKAAALGLLLDQQLGEAYLIEAYNARTKQREPQLRVGYRGLMKLGRQSGELKMIYAHEVCVRDHFDVELGGEKKLIHKPDVFSDRGPVVGYYAVAKYTDGEMDFEPMSVSQIHEIRDRSDGWRAYQEGKIKNTPWFTDEGEMAKKTVIRRLIKRLPQSPQLAAAIGIEDEAEHIDLRGHLTGFAPLPAPPPAARRLNAPESPPPEPPDATPKTTGATPAIETPVTPPPAPKKEASTDSPADETDDEEEAAAILPPDESAVLKKGLLVRLHACASTPEIEKWAKATKHTLRVLQADDRSELMTEWHSRAGELYQRERTDELEAGLEMNEQART